MQLRVTVLGMSNAQREEFKEMERLRVKGQGYRAVSDRQVIEQALRLANMRNWFDFAAVYEAFVLYPGTVAYPGDTQLPTVEQRAAQFRELDRGISAEEAIALAKEERALSQQSPPVPIGMGTDLALTLANENEEIGAPWRRLYAPDYAQFQAAKESLLRALAMIAKPRGLPAARKALGSTLNRPLERLVVITLPEFRDDRLILDPRPFIPDIDTAIAYSLALLLDKTRPIGDKRSFGDRLRRCALRQDEDNACGRWFLSFANDAGGPMPRYCCPEHRFEAGAATGGARVKRHRENRVAKHR